MVKNVIQQEISQLICDECKKEYDFDTVEIWFGYGSKLDDSKLNFCSDRCLVNWILVEQSNLLSLENNLK